MTTVIVDKELREKLNGFEHEVVFCDESGRPMGRFLPEASFMKVLYERAGHMVTDDELDRAEKESGGRALPEILNDLRKYAQSLGQSISTSMKQIELFEFSQFETWKNNGDRFVRSKS